MPNLELPQMHKITSDLAQRRARQLFLKDLPVNVDWDALPASEKRANIVLAKAKLEEKLASFSKTAATFSARKEIGVQIDAYNREINALRPKLKGSNGVPGFFIDVAREFLSKAQYNAIMAEASKRDRDFIAQGASA